MSQCRTCGQKAGLGKQECSSCEGRRQQAQRQADDAQRAQRWQAWLERRRRELLATLAQGRTPYVYTHVSVSSQARINNEVVGKPFSLAEVQELGIEGWELVGVLPQTVGVGLENTQSGSFGTHWGGGVGGNVVGALFVFRLPVSDKMIVNEWDRISGRIGASFPG